MEPALRILEALVAAQARRNQERNVKEQFPVVELIGATRLEFHLVDRIRLSDVAGGLVGLEGIGVPQALSIER